MKKLLFTVFILLTASSAFAQEDPNPTNDADPSILVPAQGAATEEKAPAAEQPANAARDTKANDPVDKVVAHLQNMNDIITKNMTNTETLLSEMKAYLDKNDKSMRMASKTFKEKIESLKVDEAETYREVAQRKLSPVLDNLITLLIQLDNANPDAAEKLDSMLKVDARYTYDP